jgi:hypothetical protein
MSTILMIALIILAFCVMFVVFEMANAPVICETREEAIWTTDQFLTSLTRERIEELRDPQRRDYQINRLGVRGWEYDAFTTCDEFIHQYIKNYPCI